MPRMNDHSEQYKEWYNKKLSSYTPNFKELGALARKQYKRRVGYTSSGYENNDFMTTAKSVIKSLGGKLTFPSSQKELEKMTKGQLFEYERSLRKMDESYINKSVLNKMTNIISKSLGKTKLEIKSDDIMKTVGRDFSSTMWKMYDAGQLLFLSSSQVRELVEYVEENENDIKNIETQAMRKVLENMENVESNIVIEWIAPF